MMTASHARPKPDPEPPGLRSLQWGWISVGLALAIQATQLPLWYGLGLLAAGLYPALSCRRHPPVLPSRPIRLLGLLAVLSAIGLAFPGQWLSREAGTALATGLLLLKALEARQRRDLQVTAGFACFVIMTSLLGRQGLVITALAGASLMAPLACIYSLQDDDPPGASLLQQTRLIASLLALALPLTACAFLLVPRLSSPLWGNTGGEADRSGLDSHLSAADFGQILNDDSPALRISFPHAPPAERERYFRTYVLWRFNGRDWSSMPPPAPGPKYQATTAGERRTYEVIMQADGGHHLPALDWPATPPAGADQWLDTDGIVHRRDAVETTIRYHLDALSSPPSNQGPLDPASRRAGLQWPAGAAPETLALGHRWRAAGLNDMAIVAKAMQMFRQQGFSYTLAPPTPSGDPTDGFLFGSRRGYCVHYASAFVLLMRAAGLPARVVSGYQGGYWNREGRYLLIRHSDAHAWAEVWIAERQAWIRFDPTAMASPERINLGALAAGGDGTGWVRHSWLLALQNHWDLVNQLWDRSVIGFDQARQTRLLSPSNRGGQWRHIDIRLGLLLIMIAMAALAVCWAQRTTSSIDPLLKAWRQLTRHLARHGLPIGTGEGPHDYLERAIRAFPARRKEIERLRTLYLLARYAESRPGPDRIRSLQRAVRNFRRGKLSEHP